MDAKFYMHESDKMALQALQAIPGFTQVFKAFMKIWSEKQYRIRNMSTNLRISENQLPKYYNMLVPICEKLGIEVPELYLELDVNANAYTAGDAKPFIVITSGLLETLPEELIPTVLAHECGHIVCHHCLYTTMGRIIMSEAISMLGLTDLAVVPIQVAFAYWMRCSELSADRVAAVCDGTADKVVEMCLRFAGFDKDIQGSVNVQEFMDQAAEYQEMVQDSAWNKTMEFLMFSNADHPLNAVRARECFEWAGTDRFHKICCYVNQSGEGPRPLSDFLNELPMTEASKQYIGKNYQDVQNELREMGFVNIRSVKQTQKDLFVKSGQVLNIRVDGKEGFKACEWIPTDAQIQIEYYEEETEEEIAAAHPGQRRTPDSSKHYVGKQYPDVINELTNAGFTEFVLEERKKAKKGWLDKEKEIVQISINGQTQFGKGEWFPKDASIQIAYMTF